MTKVFKGAAVGAVIGAVEAGAKVAGFDNQTKVETTAANLAVKAVKPASRKSDKAASANKKTKKSK